MASKSLFLKLSFLLNRLSKIKNEICTMAKTTNFESCHQYVMNQIDNIKQQLNQYQLELSNQSQSYSIISLSFDHIDHCLKEMVDRERKYLRGRNNDRLLNFKNDIHQNELFKMMSTYSTTLDLVRTDNSDLNT